MLFDIPADKLAEAARTMKVYLHEIKDTDKEVLGTDQDAWVRDTLVELNEEGERDRLRPTKAKAKSFPAKVRINLRKVDDFYVVSGDLDASVQLLCSRCGDAFEFHVHDRFSSLYSKDKETAGISYLDQKSNPRGQNKGYARHAHNDVETEAKEATDDLEIMYIAEDFLELADVIREQIQLRIPFQPLCREDCKGLCPNCGADLNVGRCACAKLTKKNAFSVLKDFKIKN